MLLEVSCFSVNSAIAAANAGADRIELCENYSLGGLSPSKNELKTVVSISSKPIFPIVRPRGGDFFYSNQEFENMLYYISYCKEIGCSGIVVGMLTSDDKVDKERMKEIIALAKPLEITFHKAFDLVADSFLAVETLVEIGCNRILTSGKEMNAILGLQHLVQLQKTFDGQIKILPGGGIRSANLEYFLNENMFQEIHTAAITENKNELVDVVEIKRMKQQILLHPFTRKNIIY